MALWSVAGAGAGAGADSRRPGALIGRRARGEERRPARPGPWEGSGHDVTAPRGGGGPAKCGKARRALRRRRLAAADGEHLVGGQMRGVCAQARRPPDRLPATAPRATLH